MLVVPPQLKDLPGDATIGMACRSCRAHWSENVRDLVEIHRMGAEYADLLEWKLRCACDGLVRVSLPSEIWGQVTNRQATSILPSQPSLPYPVKAVVKSRRQGNGPAPVHPRIAAFPH